MSTPHTSITTVYQWRTSNGAIAQEHLTEDDARKWMERRNQMASLVDGRTKFPDLNLHMVETSTTDTLL